MWLERRSARQILRPQLKAPLSPHDTHARKSQRLPAALSTGHSSTGSHSCPLKPKLEKALDIAPSQSNPQVRDALKRARRQVELLRDVAADAGGENDVSVSVIDNGGPDGRSSSGREAAGNGLKAVREKHRKQQQSRGNGNFARSPPKRPLSSDDRAWDIPVLVPRGAGENCVGGGGIIGRTPREGTAEHAVQAKQHVSSHDDIDMAHDVDDGDRGRHASTWRAEHVSAPANDRAFNGTSSAPAGHSMWQQGVDMKLDRLSSTVKHLDARFDELHDEVENMFGATSTAGGRRRI